MNPTLHVAAPCGALVLAAVVSTAQSSNDAPLNNGGEYYFTYSDPSVGFPTGTFPPDLNGDLWWRAHPGDGFMNDVDPVLGSAMEIDGYLETLFDEDWSTVSSFLDRMHGPAVRNPVTGGLEPAFFSVGLTSEVLVSLGSTGLGDICTLYPSLASPSGSCCPLSGAPFGWIVDIQLGSTPGSGVVLPADGTAASNTATTYFFQGGWSTVGGSCGWGTYETNDFHSIDETQADPTGLGVNPFGGFQIGGGGPIPEGIVSMSASHETYRGNVVNVVADSGTGLGVEDSFWKGGGAMNGRNLSVGSGLATLGVELRDLAGAAGPNVGVVGASTAPLANPGVPLLGGWLGVSPNGLFAATSGIWQGTVTTIVPGFSIPPFTSEGILDGAQLPVPATLAGTSLHLQGATFSLVTLTADTTNVVRTNLLP
jgi:hypothetical protein